MTQNDKWQITQNYKGLTITMYKKLQMIQNKNYLKWEMIQNYTWLKLKDDKWLKHTNE